MNSAEFKIVPISIIRKNKKNTGKKKMDLQILRAILQSHEEVMKDAENSRVFEKNVTEGKFPPTDRKILEALARSFADLLNYKVSPEAHQRYAVRIQVIEVLRDWIRPPRELRSSRTFSHGERMLEFVERIANTYLANDIPFLDSRTDTLVALANALITLSSKRANFANCVERLLDRIAELEPTESSQLLLLAALEEKEILELSPRLVEKLYVSQSRWLIEEPLIHNFVESLQTYEDIKAVDLKITRSLDRLLKIAAISPKVFQTVCAVINEIFIRSDYSPKVSNYTQLILDSLDRNCRESSKKLLDLYPLSLQYCVLLLKIDPEQHTPHSRQYVLKNLRIAHQANAEDALILISHFPKWLRYFSKHLARHSDLEIPRGIKILDIDD